MAPTARPVVKARTPTSAPGNRRGPVRPAGFTLVELLVVLVLIGLAAAVVSLALRDPAASRLDQEAARLGALLEAGRAEARASGLPVRFELGSQGGFRFSGLPPRVELPQHWLNEGVQARIVGARALLLGPEPLIGAQRVELTLEDRRISVATDGLAPFKALTDETPP
ncbi:MAG: prepilin-type N-terminal cleavage/methylation domain-containing protein [Ideonella sp.]|nr:prepilin-type N-terminal cleavage/methylation domain-containing protein [Ideonella sp.]